MLFNLFSLFLFSLLIDLLLKGKRFRSEFCKTETKGRQTCLEPFQPAQPSGEERSLRHGSGSRNAPCHPGHIQPLGPSCLPHGAGALLPLASRGFAPSKLSCSCAEQFHQLCKIPQGSGGGFWGDTSSVGQVLTPQRC